MKNQASISLPAAVCLAILGTGFAMASPMATPSHAGMNEAMQMVPAEADLVKTLDAQKMHAGEQFEARLSSKVHLKNGTELPRGTELVGKVVTDQMNTDGQNSTLALRFTQAELKDGKTLPIKATIVGLYRPASGSFYGATQTPNYWTDKTLQVDQIGVIAGVNLHSRIAARNSGVFVSKKKDNMKFGVGDEFAIAIAPRS